jgi:hypothetical protein
MLTSNGSVSWLTQFRQREDLKDLANLRHDAFLVDTIADVAVHINQWPDDAKAIALALKKHRRDHAQASAAHAEKGNTMGDICKTLRHLDETIIIDWVLKHSDIDEKSIFKAISFNSDAPWILLSHALQMSTTCKIHPVLSNHEVFNRFATARASACDDLLENFCATGGIGGDGKLIFKDRILMVHLNPAKLVIKLTHVPSGTSVDVAESFHMTPEFDFDGFWCLDDAKAQMKPMPPIKLGKFFASKVGLIAYTLGNNKPANQKVLNSFAASIEAKWLADIAAVQGNTATLDKRSQISAKVKDLHSDKKKSVIAGTRAKSLATVSARISKRLTDVK